MKMQDSISRLSLSNFLRFGAFLRWEDECHFVGLSENAVNFSDPRDFSVWSPLFFDLSPKPSLVNEWIKVPRSTLNLPDFTKSLQTCVEQNLIPTSEVGFQNHQWYEPAKGTYEKSFNETMQRIAKGPLRKAVPFSMQVSNSSIQPAEKVELITNSLKAFSTLFSFGFWTPTEGIIGATPEILFSRKGSKLETMALAGTKAKDKDFDREIFLNSSKERDEHAFVIEDIVSKLSQYGEVHVGDTQVVEYPNLAHLRTQIEVTLADTVKNEDLINALHPTPALGVFPRTEMPWFQTLPYQNTRRRFGAPILFQWEDKAVALVCIRSLEWDQRHTWISAGGGVVKESTLEGEWAEIKTKLSSIWKSMGIDKISSEGISK